MSRPRSSEALRDDMVARVEGGSESSLPSSRYSDAMECEGRGLKRSSTRRIMLTEPDMLIRDEMLSSTCQAASILDPSLEQVFDALHFLDVFIVCA